MRLPDELTDRLAFLEPLKEPWRPVQPALLVLAAAFYGVFLLQAAHGSGPFLMIDLVFVPIHEGGHLLFRWFGEFLAVAGGTILQLAVPLLLGMYFALQRQILGTAFCSFFLFEQFLPISTYMADARAQELPLLTVGGGDDVIHDWNYLFCEFGVLNHDVQIAHAVRLIGWTGMLAVVAWMIFAASRAAREQNRPSTRNDGLRDRSEF